jgi:hypothetical protein
MRELDDKCSSPKIKIAEVRGSACTARQRVVQEDEPIATPVVNLAVDKVHVGMQINDKCETRGPRHEDQLTDAQGAMMKRQLRGTRTK